MRISVIGCGYVGLITATCLAEIGHHVVCADEDEEIIRRLHGGQLPIYEAHLEAILERRRREGRLVFTDDSADALRTTEALFICVGVPQLENGDADLTVMDNLARLIASEPRSPKLIIIRSTVPVETGQRLKEMLAVYGRTAGVRFRVTANPQFLREGTAVEDFLHPDRILIGVEDESSEQQLREIYRPILERRFNCPVHPQGCPPLAAPELLITAIKSAELIKHVSNSFLALKISYANVLADFCERLSADVTEVTRGMGLDRRIGPQFLRPGLGFGGFRLPKDLRALIRLADRAGIDSGLLKEIERVNRERMELFLEKIRRALWVIKEKRIGVLGLAFKPDTDDVRFSPAIEVTRRLLAEGAHVRAYDPKAMGKTQELYPDIHCVPDPYAAAENADALVILTDWEQFRQLDWGRIRESLARPLVLDGRNLLEPASMKQLGFEYHSIGRAG